MKTIPKVRLNVSINLGLIFSYIDSEVAGFKDLFSNYR